ncbi:hypothetical protein MRX60_09395 [Xylella fastidiosa subsp. pauca]|uniref:hypothetical protein n=1 Tax=Xylella fastidiosa TaxID=2371 RepID=UPI00241C8CE0|nr:hypothetical protein [Xylella fastidiosa]MDG5826276.1 hypothetical protein [Xylella fastidiosa subsp. pauca]
MILTPRLSVPSQRNEVNGVLVFPAREAFTAVRVANINAVLPSTVPKRTDDAW